MSVERYGVVGENANIDGETSQGSEIDRAIAGIAARQHGNIARQQLVGLGLVSNAIAHRVKLGRLYRVYRGVYSVGRPTTTPLERAAAAVLACGAGAALSHGSAMTLWGLAKRWATPFEVTVPGDRRPKGIVVHRSCALDPRDVTTQLGIRVTTPARTVLDCAPRLSDNQLVRAVNDGLLARYLQESHLAELLSRCPRHPAAARLRGFTSTEAELTRSRFEDEFPGFCERFKLPCPTMNAHIAGYEVDALFPDERLIVELDGYEFHSGRKAFEDDRNRDADTLAAGHETVRITWRRIEQTPEAEADRLLKILRARRRHAA